MTPSEIQSAIASDTRATARVLRYLDRRGIRHSGRISGATLASVLGVDSRTWRRYVDGSRGLPEMGRRLLAEVSRVEI